MWTEKYIPLLRQEYPDVFTGCNTVDDYFHALTMWFVMDWDYKHPTTVQPLLAENKERYGTIAYLEECYEQGYSAIINDGKLLGFRKEK